MIQFRLAPKYPAPAQNPVQTAPPRRPARELALQEGTNPKRLEAARKATEVVSKKKKKKNDTA